MVSEIAKALVPTYICKGILKGIEALDDNFSCMDVPDLVLKQQVVFECLGRSLFLRTAFRTIHDCGDKVEGIAVVEITCVRRNCISSKTSSANGQRNALIEDHDAWKVLWSR
jgi:hypothetical protein